MIDVRDVALAHIRAAETTIAKVCSLLRSTFYELAIAVIEFDTPLYIVSGKLGLELVPPAQAPI